MKRVPRVLLVAFALSLLLHLIVALILHPPTPTPESLAEVVSIEHRPATIAVTKPPTPPPPRPKQTPAPRTASSAPPARKGPGQGGTLGASGPTPAPVVAAATAAPTPIASAADCTRGDIAAAVTSTPVPPEITPETRASGTSGIARVTVQLDSGGQVTGASIAQSTGNSSLDLVAVGMARDAHYTPELHACKAVASSYTYSVKFVAW